MKPKLYQYAACPFCNKVKAILEYKGVDYDVIEVDPLKKTEIAFSKDYQAVPIYINSAGTQVNDSTPIMRAIDKEFPEPRVFETDAGKIDLENKWLAWSEKFVKGLPAAIYDSFANSTKAFDYITKVGKFSWFKKRMIKYFGAFVMTVVAKKIKKREQINEPAEFVKQMAGEWATGLNGKPFMGGEKPNGADLAVFGIVRSVAGLPAGDLLRTNRIFNQWLEKVTETMQSEEVLS